MHHARWLAKAIYCLKIFIFRHQFTLTNRETSNLREMCTFIVTFYVKAWFTAPPAIKAPYHDLNLMQVLVRNEMIDRKVAEAASTKLARHLWYISEELVALSFFDNVVPRETKLKIIHSIKHRDTAPGNLKRVVLKKNEFKSLLSKDISDFVTKKSIFFFEKLELDTRFLNLDPNLWEMDENYENVRKTVQNLKVVNDVAERGVALVEQFNNSLTKKEDEKQYLLQVVQQHRQRFPNCSKKEFIGNTVRQ